MRPSFLAASGDAGARQGAGIEGAANSNVMIAAGSWGLPSRDGRALVEPGEATNEWGGEGRAALGWPTRGQKRCYSWAAGI